MKKNPDPLPLTQKVKLWERMNNESSREYDAFRKFLELGPRRTSLQVSTQLQLSRVRVRNMRAAHRWDERVLAYEDHINSKLMEDEEQVRREANIRHIEEAQDLQSQVRDYLRTFDPSLLSPIEAAQWLRIGVEIERKCLKLDTPVSVVAIQQNFNLNLDSLAKMLVDVLREEEKDVRDRILGRLELVAANPTKVVALPSEEDTDS